MIVECVSCKEEYEYEDHEYDYARCPNCDLPYKHNSKGLSFDEVMQLLNAELVWCVENKTNDSQFSGEYKEGFIRGINQSKYLITQLAGLDPYETLKNEIMSEWVESEEE